MSLGLRRSTALAVALTGLGAVLIGGAAAALAARDYPLYESAVQVRLLADPIIGDEIVAGNRGSDGDSNFIATELVTLNGDDLRAPLRQRLQDPSLTVEAVRVGTADVVQVTIRSKTAKNAASAALLLDRYAEGRRAELRKRIDGTGAEVERQLRSVNAEIIRLTGDQSVTAQVQRGALTTEYTRLFERRSTVQVASEASQRLFQVVTNEEEAPRQVVQPARDGVLGAVAGAVLGLGAALAVVRLRRRVGGLEDLLELAPELALPTLPPLRGPDLLAQAGHAASGWVSALSEPARGFGMPALVVVAPTEGCGATFVAVAVAVASARRCPTVLVALGDVLDGRAATMLGVDLTAMGGPRGLPTAQAGLSYMRLSALDGDEGLADLEARIARGLVAELGQLGVAVVLDAPALSRSGAALDLAKESAGVLLVGGVDVTAAAELDAAARAVRRVGASLTGVVLSSPRARSKRRRGGR